MGSGGRGGSRRDVEVAEGKESCVNSQLSEFLIIAKSIL